MNPPETSPIPSSTLNSLSTALDLRFLRMNNSLQHLIPIEQERLKTEQQRLAIEQERLTVEKERLTLEKTNATRWDEFSKKLENASPYFARASIVLERQSTPVRKNGR